MGRYRRLAMSDRPQRERKASTKMEFLDAHGDAWEQSAKKSNPKRKSGGSGSSKKKKAKSDGSKGSGVKKAVSAYLHFSNDMREEVKIANPKASFGEIGRILGQWWADLGRPERMKYEKIAQLDRARYEREVRAEDGW